MIAALLFSFSTKIASFHSWRARIAMTIAGLIGGLELLAIIFCNHVVLSAGIVMGVVFAIYFTCLLAWRQRAVVTWTWRQRSIAIALGFLVLLPMWFVDLNKTFCNVHEYVPGHGSFPVEILGLSMTSTNYDGMVRATMCTKFGGKMYEIGLLEDATMRKAEGPIFVLASRRQTEKTRLTVSITAQTDIMSKSDDKKILSLAKVIADALQEHCGLVMKRLASASVKLQAQGDVKLYHGTDGILVADITWVDLDDRKGVIKMSLLETNVEREGSAYHAELMANLETKEGAL